MIYLYLKDKNINKPFFYDKSIFKEKKVLPYYCLRNLEKNKTKIIKNQFVIKPKFTYTLSYIDESHFEEWFTSFSEGDASFKGITGGQLKFFLNQSSFESDILYFIQRKLGFGSIHVREEIYMHEYTVSSKEELLKIISLFNGNFLLNKRMNQFKKWLARFNKKNKKKIKFIQNKRILSLNNVQLCGLTDSEGCFTAAFTKRKTFTQVRVIFEISQTDEKNVLEKIALLFGGTVYPLNKTTGPLKFRITHLKKFYKVFSYFDKYPLKCSVKSVSYKYWCELHGLVVRKAHLKKEGFLEIKRIAKKINPNSYHKKKHRLNKSKQTSK